MAYAWELFGSPSNRALISCLLFNYKAPSLTGGMHELNYVNYHLRLKFAKNPILTL